jgi:hypothetical protein
MIEFNKGRFINDVAHFLVGVAVGVGISYAIWWHQIGAGLAEFARHG